MLCSTVTLYPILLLLKRVVAVVHAKTSTFISFAPDPHCRTYKQRYLQQPDRHCVGSIIRCILPCLSGKLPLGIPDTPLSRHTWLLCNCMQFSMLPNSPLQWSASPCASVVPKDSHPVAFRATMGVHATPDIAFTACLHQVEI